MLRHVTVRNKRVSRAQARTAGVQKADEGNAD